MRVKVSAQPSATGAVVGAADGADVGTAVGIAVGVDVCGAAVGDDDDSIVCSRRELVPTSTESTPNESTGGRVKRHNQHPCW